MSAGEAIWLETTRTKVDYWTAAHRVLITRPEVLGGFLIAMYLPIFTIAGSIN